jgi:hypothetical protein
MEKKMITVSVAIARLLEQMGTEVVFGLNGHGNWGLLDALVYETKIECIGGRTAADRDHERWSGERQHHARRGDGILRIHRHAGSRRGRRDALV